MMSQILRLSDGRGVRALTAGAGAPLVLIHGVGMRAEAWTPQIAVLSATHRVIAVDMPGHGDSDALAEGALLPEFVAWAVAVIEALGLGPVNLAGHSMGALIAAGVAVERPDLVRRAALLNGVHRRSLTAQAAVRQRAAEIAAGTGDFETALDRWFGPQDAAVRHQVAGWLGSVSHRGYATAYRAFAEGDAVYADRFGQIRCPLLALTGDGDANSTPVMSETMAAMAGQGRAVVIAGHRHVVNLTAPAAVTEKMQQWLATQESVE